MCRAANDPVMKMQLSREFRELVELRRVLLRIPGPGRDSGQMTTMRMTNVPGVVQDAIEPSGPVESASADASSGPTAGPTDQAPPLS